MSLALARTHGPGQPEYVRAHSLWVKRTPTCVSGSGSGRGEVALPAGVGLSKFGVRNRLWRMRQYEARLAQFEHPCLFFQRVDDLVQRSLVTSNHWQPGTPRAQQRAPRKARRVARRTRWQHQQARQQLARRREDHRLPDAPYSSGPAATITTAAPNNVTAAPTP